MMDSSDSPLSGVTPAKLLNDSQVFFTHLLEVFVGAHAVHKDIQRPRCPAVCSYVAEKPGGCLYKITPDNAKFHSLFKSYLYLQINLIYHALQWNFLLLFCSFITKKVGKQIDQYSNLKSFSKLSAYI